VVTASEPAIQVAPRPRRGAGKSSFEQLAEHFKPAVPKTMFHSRIPTWLDELINQRVLEMKTKGFSKITKEAVVTDALKQYFGVEAPE
jgi:hypothetical protein